MGIATRLINAFDPLHEATHEVRQAFAAWCLEGKVLQVRYIAFLTALLYLCYATIQFFIATEWLGRRLFMHGLFVPLMLVLIGSMSFSPALHRPMWALLTVSPIPSVFASLYFNAGRDGFPLYAPELYLILIWTFAISGLMLRQAMLAASSSLLMILAAMVMFPPDPGFIKLHLLYLLAAFSFGFLSALLLEKGHKAMFLQQRRLTHLASVDGLTGLWNRQETERRFAEECERTDRYGTPVSLILLDLDHFKQVNDEHGHTVGDTVLKEFAALLRTSLRSVDQVGRIGGEEFLIVLPETGLQQARAVADMLQERINCHRFETVGQCTASFGVTQYHPEEGRLAVINRIDRALYQAKAQGRNRIEILPCSVERCRACAAVRSVSEKRA